MATTTKPVLESFEIRQKVERESGDKGKVYVQETFTSDNETAFSENLD